MNKDLNSQIESMMADFQKRQEEVKNEIANLRKSTAVIQDNIKKEYEIVENAFCEDLRTAWELFKTIQNSGSRVESDFYRQEFFSVFDAKRISFSSRLYIWTCTSRKDINLNIGELEIVLDNNGFYYKKDGSYHLDHMNWSKKEMLVVFYKTGILTDMIIECLSEHLQQSMKDYQTELDRQKCILENAEPISNKNDTHWSDYIMYLLKWSSEHADKEFAGMSPACYDEWLDNEQGE